MRWWKRNKQHPFWIKLFNWEYWPSMAFYWPMFIYGPWLALRFRHPCFFTAANPGMFTSGLGLESKFDTIRMLPEELRPNSILVPVGANFEEVLIQIRNSGLEFPLIVKPDIGYRGLLVKKADNPEALQACLSAFPINFIIQEFLDYPEERGVFYCRMPDEPQGRVISLTLKEFLHVEGDGNMPVSELVGQKPRARLQMARLQETHAHLLPYVPPAGEKVRLGVVGNHSKGTTFFNGISLIDEQLSQTFDRICKQIDGFYYGRFDIKCRSLEDLKAGRHFKIIELNGIGSEPTHIYDQSGMSYFQALRTIMKQWELVARISAANHKIGAPYMSVREMLRTLRDWRGYVRKLAPQGKAEQETNS